MSKSNVVKLPLAVVGLVTLRAAARLPLAFGDGTTLLFPAGTVFRKLAGDAAKLTGHDGCVLVQSRGGNVFAAPAASVGPTRHERKPQL